MSLQIGGSGIVEQGLSGLKPSTFSVVGTRTPSATPSGVPVSPELKRHPHSAHLSCCPSKKMCIEKYGKISSIGRKIIFLRNSILLQGIPAIMPSG